MTQHHKFFSHTRIGNYSYLTTRYTTLVKCQYGAEIRNGRGRSGVANTEIKCFNSAPWLLIPAGFSALQARGAILPTFLNKTQEEGRQIEEELRGLILITQG